MLETRITALVAKLGEKIKYLFTWKAGRDENNTFTENNEFTKPLKVANPVNDGDAVNKRQINALQPSFARYRMTHSLKYTGFSIFDETLFEENINTNITSDSERIIIPENGYYKINAVLNSFGIAGGQAHVLEIFKNTRNGYLSGNLSNIGGRNISASTGVIQLESGDEIGLWIYTGNNSEIHEADLSIQKVK